MTSDAVLRVNDFSNTAQASTQVSPVAARAQRRNYGRRAEDRVRQDEIIVEHLRDYAVFLLDAAGRVSRWNVGAERVLGWREDEILGEPGELIFTPEDRARGAPQAELDRAREDGHAADERWHVRRDGSRFYTSGQVMVVRDDAGDVTGFVKVMRDMTERVQAQAALRASEAKYRALFEAIDEGVCLIGLERDAQGRLVEARYLDANPAAERITGRTLPGLRLAEVMDGGDEGAWLAVCDRVASTGQGERAERHVGSLGRWFDAYAFRPDPAHPDRVALVFKDVTERRALIDDLREADRRKDEFIAMLSHELRNPLAPIFNGVKLLERNEHFSDTGRRALEMIKRQIRQLKHLVDDLLEIGRLTRGHIRLRPVRMSLTAAVQAAVEMALPMCDAKQQALTARLPKAPIRLVADPVRVAQVLENLLTNASKYTPRGGWIRIEAAQADDHVEVRVIDSGIGIEPSKLSSVFEMFVQAEPSLGEFQGGLGIGLALVQRFVDMHGGHVHAESAGRGRGATFVVRLPRRGPDA